MEPLILELSQLRLPQSSQIHLLPGRALMARVIERDPSGHGTLSIAGSRLEATLPPNVRAGDELRLVVRDVSGNRLVLALSDPSLQPQPQLREDEAVTDREADGHDAEQAGAQTVSLRYPAPTLGAMDLRLAQVSDTLTVTITLAAGALDHASAAADELRAALSQATGKTVAVAVQARREPLDIYA